MSTRGGLSERFDGLVLAAGARLDRLWDDADGVEMLDAHGQIARAGAVLGGRYRLEAVLGEGAFGRVWRAVALDDERPVAIKELKRDAASADEVVLADAESQLAQEFFTLSRLRHPNIVGVHDYGELDGGGSYLVMELVPGQDVHERIKHGPLPQQEAAAVLVGLLQGLQLLHSRLYVHGDIKAENLRVTPEGHVKLMDFGLLHQLGTPATQLQGTVEYMAPEIMQGGVIDGRTDLYSVGVLAYEMFTGGLPFTGESMTELLGKHLRETPLPPSHYLDLDQAVDDVVLRLMGKAPDARYPDAAAALTDLAPLAGAHIDAGGIRHSTSYLYAAELVGRDVEREELERLRSTVKAGRAARVFIGGRGGEGKTRLLEELRLKAKLEGLSWAGGQCRQDESAPRGPMIQALSAVAARCSDEALEPWGGTLATLLPEVVARGFAPERPPDPVKAKELLFESLVAWLAAAAAERPTVLCVEDLHWADGGTVELLNHLLRNVDDGCPLAIVGTLRTDEVDATHQVLATIREERTALLKLSPLTPESVRELLAGTLHAFEPPDAFIDELHDKSGGNAFFLVETLRWLVEADVLRAVDRGFVLDGVPDLPASIPELVERRLGHLPEGLLTLCQALAPVGRVVDLPVASALCDLEGEALFGALEDLVGRQFLVRSKQQVRFAHDTIREGVYASLDAQRRAALHLQVGELLERRRKQGRDVEPAQLAGHFQRSTAPPRAVPYFLEGADRAVAADQLLEATQLLMAGAAIAETQAPAEGELPADLRATLVAFYDKIALISPRALPPANVRAVDRLVEIWSGMLDLDVARDRLERKEQRRKRLPKPLREWAAQRRHHATFTPSTTNPALILSRMLEHRASQAFNLGVIGQAERAEALADELGQTLGAERPVQQIWCHTAVIIASIHSGRTPNVIAHAHQAQAILDRVAGSPSPILKLQQFLVAYFEAIAVVLSGAAPDEALLKKVEAIAERSGKLQDRLSAILPPVVYAALRGLPDPFATYGAEADAIIQRLNHPQPLTSRHKLWLPIYYLDRGELDLAEAVIARIGQYAEGSRDAWLHTYHAIYQGQLLVAREAWDEAEAVLDEAVRGCEAAGLARVGWAWVARARARYGRGRVDDARADVAAAVALATDPATASPYDELLARRVEGLLGDDAQAKDALDRALSLARATANPIQEALVLEARAARFLSDDDRASAQAIFKQLRHPRADVPRRSAS